MHPNENTFYLSWRALYLHALWERNATLPFAIVLGAPVYRSLYGVWATSSHNIERVALYVNDRLIRTTDEPYEWDESLREWRMKWCWPGFHEITVGGCTADGDTDSCTTSILVVI